MLKNFAHTKPNHSTNLTVILLDTRWISWTCFSTCVLSLPLMLVLKAHFYRLDVETEDLDDSTETEPESI